VVPNDSDEQLGARLDSALQAGLESDQVDVAGLLTGSRRRARRLRSQRITLVAAVAVLMIGVPAGLEVFRPNAGAGPPAVMLGSTSAPASALGSSRFRPGELPPGLVLADQTAHNGLPIVAGEVCEANGTPASPAGRQWTWQTKNKADGLSVRLVVTHWTPGTAARPFDDLVQSTGSCTWPVPQTVQKFTDARGLSSSDETWSAGSTRSGVDYGRAVIRTGDWIAGVEVRDPSGQAAAVKLAQELAGRLAQRYADGSP
jgi:hypothetical protein